MDPILLNQLSLLAILLYAVMRGVEGYRLMATKRQVTLLHRSVSGVHVVVLIFIVAHLTLVGEPIAIIKVLFLVTLLFWQIDVEKHRVNLGRALSSRIDRLPKKGRAAIITAIICLLGIFAWVSIIIARN